MSGFARTLAAAAALAGMTAAVAACRRPSGDATPSVGPAPLATAPAPVDHLAAGELLEGSAVAFGLRLPRGIAVEGAFADDVVASGPVDLRPFVDYLRARLQGGELRQGDMSATFDRVRVAGQTAPELRIHVGVSPEGVRVDIRDLTVPEVPPLPDEAARWRRVGLTPDGHLADPQHLD